MSKKLFLFYFLFIVITAQSQGTLIRVGKFYNSELNIFENNVDILIEGQLIKKIGTNLALPENTKFIECKNCTATPGLIDAHTHFLFQQSPNKTSIIDDRLKNSDSARLIRAKIVCEDYLKNGFTTVRDIGNSGGYLDVSLKELAKTGIFPAPSLFVSGPIINPYGGQSDNLPDTLQVFVKKEYSVIDGETEAIKTVEEHIEQRVDFIKICADNDPGKLFLSVNEIRAIVATAHKFKLPVTAHAVFEKSVRLAVAGGVDGIEHGYRLSDSILSVMAERKIYLVPNDMPLNEIKPLSEYAKKEYAARKDRFTRAYNKGIKIVFGSDMTLDERNGKGSSRFAKKTLLAYYEYGFGAADVVKFATRNPAEILGAYNKIGVLKEQAIADIVIFDGDLEKDFPNVVFKIKQVFKNGKSIK